MATVSLISPNLNGRQHLETLLASISAQSYPADRIEVIVVDNGSSDGSVAYLRERHPMVRIIENAANEGFARPNNQAAAIATGDYLLLVNNDMKLASDWVARMVSAIEAAPPDVACIASRILNWDGSAVDFIKGEMAFNGMGLQPGYGARIDSPEARSYPDELLFACGGAMLIRREVFLEIGGFDEDYFAYYEDVDLGWRLWVLGYRVRFCPEAVVHHLHNGTSKRFDPWKKTVLFERNALCSVIKNYEEATLGSVLPAALLLVCKRAAVRSGVAREAFRFGPTPPRPAVPELPATSRLGKLMGNLGRLGLKGTLQKAAVIAARRVLERWGSPADAPGETVSVACEAYAGLVGLEDVMDYLPRMLEKRRWIQARRKRSDADVAKLFGDALMPVEGRGDYIATHWQLVRELEIAARLGARDGQPA